MLHFIVDCAKTQPARKQSEPKQAIKDTIGQMTSSLAPGVQDRVAALLWKYQEVIALNDNDLGCTQLLGHRINTSPVHQPA